MTSKNFVRDPESVLDYEFDWSLWLGPDDTIISHTATVTGATLGTSTASTTSVVVWVSGGTVGTNATVECKVVTAAGRTDERTITLHIAER